eukprot:scaffold1.g5251.t1
MSSADELKAKGNAAFAAGDFPGAVEAFTAAIAAAPDNHVLYSNRSAALASQGKYEEALADARKVVELRPDWPKGYSRVGAAAHGLRKYDEAVEAYTKGLQLDPGSEQLKAGLEAAKAAQASAGGRAFSGLFSRRARGGGLTGGQCCLWWPGPLPRHEVNRDPNAMQRFLPDDRFQLALEVGLGLRMTADEPPASASGAHASGTEPMAEEQQQQEEQQAPAPAAQPKEAEQRSEEEWEAINKKKEAQQEKELGNAAYKAKNFDDALQHYGRALELDDTDISFLTNRAAVHFEMGDYDACVADCDAAVERGRELRADYKLVARALTRKGNALVKQDLLEEAIAVYNKSLTEHRNADTLKRLNDAERALKERRETEYISLDLSNEEKEKGNEAFKEQRYPEAVAHYTEALKRGPPSINPEAYKLYSNRAACYTKLGAWSEGVKDADECIRLKPDFAKGYSRKGHLQFFMKDYDKAMETYQEGLKHDPDSAELKEGLMRCIEGINKLNRGEVSEEERQQRQQRAMQDPEVQGILTDPIMRQVLQDMQENAAAAQKHMSNPMIARKIEKLVAAGILQIR